MNVLKHLASHPVEVHVESATEDRNRLTSAFRLALTLFITWSDRPLPVLLYLHGGMPDCFP